MRSLLALAALLFVGTIAFQQLDEDELEFELGGSFYKRPINSFKDDSPSYETSPLQLYYDFRYHEYYPDGQTVVAIIFLDILLPIACCILIIFVVVCIVRAARRNAQQ